MHKRKLVFIFGALKQWEDKTGGVCVCLFAACTAAGGLQVGDSRQRRRSDEALHFSAAIAVGLWLPQLQCFRSLTHTHKTVSEDGAFLLSGKRCTKVEEVPDQEVRFLRW